MLITREKSATNIKVHWDCACCCLDLHPAAGEPCPSNSLSPSLATATPCTMRPRHLQCNVWRCRHGACFRLMRLCGAAPQVSLTDLARAALLPPDSLSSFNPFLSAASCARLKGACLIWMQLCVLEDRLRRVRRLAHAGPESLPLLLQVLWCKLLPASFLRCALLV